MDSLRNDRRLVGILLGLAVYTVILVAAWHQGGMNDRYLVLPLGLGGLVLAWSAWREALHHRHH